MGKKFVSFRDCRVKDRMIKGKEDFVVEKGKAKKEGKDVNRAEDTAGED